MLARRRLMADVAAAFCGLALLGLLQNVDVILLGRLDHANVGPYAAISVASKALVFGALALGAYLSAGGHHPVERRRARRPSAGGHPHLPGRACRPVCWPSPCSSPRPF